MGDLGPMDRTLRLRRTIMLGSGVLLGEQGRRAVPLTPIGHMRAGTLLST
jgi:hypothetical protein